MNDFPSWVFPTLPDAQRHHIAPVSQANHDIIKLLITRSGGSFTLNDANNIIYLPSTILENQTPIHRGSDIMHAAYNRAWEAQLGSGLIVRARI